MTSLRGTSSLVFYIITVALLVVITVTTRIAYGATSPDGGITVPTAPTTVVTIPDSKGGPTNLAAGSNMECENYVYPLDCKQIDKNTGKEGGQGCPCTTGLLPSGAQIHGICTFDSEQKKGVCHAINLTEVTNTTKSSDALPAGATVNPSAGSPESGVKANVTPVNLSGSAAPGVAGAYTPAPAATPTSVPSPTSGNAPAPASSIGAIGNSPSGYPEVQPPSTIGAPPVPTGNNWSNLAQYENNLSGTYYIQPPSVITPVYYQPTYQENSQGYYGSSSVITFSSSGTTSVNNSLIGLDNFIRIISGAGNTALETTQDIYKSLSGLAENSPIDVPNNVNTDAETNPVFDTSITATNTTEEPSENPPTESNVSVTELASASPVVVAAQGVQDSLGQLRTTVDTIIEASATTTGIVNTTDTSSADAVNSGLEATQKRASELQAELEAGQEKLNGSDARVQELTRELNALNERIKAVNQQVADPSLSESDRWGLLSSLIENIQLALSDAEQRLETATADSPPPTVGQVVVTGFSAGVSGFVDWTVSLSEAFANFIQNIWHALFPAY